MPKIKTLIKDIYNLVIKGIPADEVDDYQEIFDEFGRHMADMLKQKMTTREKRKRSFAFSRLGYPLRKAWYAMKQYEEEPLLPATKIKFFYGDMCEAYLLALAKLSGHTVEGQQERLDYKGVMGYQDAVIDGHMVDVKSASTYSYKAFEKGLPSDPFGYKHQLGGYYKANKKAKSPSYFLVMDKTLGHLMLSEWKAKDLPDTDAKIKAINEVLKSDTPPERCYAPVPMGKKGNYALGMECSYCPFKQECWKNVNDGKGVRTFLYSYGPKYLVQVEDEPRVPEVKG